MKIKAISIKKSFKKTNILVIGDLMLDKYSFGNSSRQSPEAPVPIIDEFNEDIFLGGAANTALNIKMLGGGEVSCCGVIGKDNSGKMIKNLIKKNNINCNGVVVNNSHKTTTKKRIYLNDKQMLRLDNEQNEISFKSQSSIKKFLKEEINNYDLIVISDYNKGVITKTLVGEIKSLCKKNKTPIIVDPKQNFSVYQGVDYITPNLKEFQKNSNLKKNTLSEISLTGRKIINKHKIKNILVTLGEKGMILIDDCSKNYIKTQKVKEADVVGAGDTVIAALSLCIASNLDKLLSIQISNIAAKISVSKSATSTVNFDEIEADIINFL